jgi:hypothetical protein
LRLVASGVAKESSKGAQLSALSNAAAGGAHRGKRACQRQRREAGEQQPARRVAQRASSTQASARHQTSNRAQHAAAAALRPRSRRLTPGAGPTRR